MKVLRLFRVYIDSNIHVSVTTALYAAHAFVLNDLPFSIPFVCFVFWSTFSVYNVHRYIGAKDILELKTFLHADVLTDKNIILSISGLLAAMAFAVYGGFYLYLIFWIAFVISGIYMMPYFGARRIREIAYFKIFMISIVWALVCGSLPYQISHLEGIEYITLERFAYIFAITLPFDYKDASDDSLQGFKSIGNQWNESQVCALSIAMVAVCGMLTYIMFDTALIGMEVLISNFIVYGLTCMVLYFSFRKQSELYYTGLIDGLPVLFLILLYLCRWVL